MNWDHHLYVDARRLAAPQKNIGHDHHRILFGCMLKSTRLAAEDSCRTSTILP
jgi:hypothetical protein